MEFKDSASEDIYNGRRSKAARRALKQNLHAAAAKKLDFLAQANSLADLGTNPGNRLEALKGDRAGQHSIRINDQYRICFQWLDGEAREVEVCDYH
jgi:proteic killer suppression protein